MLCNEGFELIYKTLFTVEQLYIRVLCLKVCWIILYKHMRTFKIVYDVYMCRQY